MRIEMEAFQIGHILKQGRWYQPGKYPDCAPSDYQSDEAAGACKQEAFHHELENESSTPCSQSSANGNLSPTALYPDQQ